MRRAALLGLALVASSALSSGPAFGQTGRGAHSSLSADTIPLGYTVELRISVPVPAGSTVYVPGTLPPTASLESHGAMTWSAEPAPDGAVLTLTYPLLALGVGRVQVPGVDILVRPGRVAGGTALPGGSVIGAWDEAPTPNAAANVLARIPPREMRVASLFELDGVVGGVGPMPAADVVGPSLGRVPIALLGASGLILIGVLAMALRRLWSRSGRARADGSAPVSIESGRRAALKALDDLLALDLHGKGRIRDFYTRTSEIVRRYVELFEPRWGPNLTSTELMRELEARASGEAVTTLSAEMGHAEIVKFGQPRSDAALAEAHWRKVRDWVQGSEGPTS